MISLESSWIRCGGSRQMSRMNRFARGGGELVGALDASVLLLEG